jgi:hypothetical protein
MDCGKYHHWDGSGCTATIARRTAGGPAPAQAVSPWEAEAESESAKSESASESAPESAEPAPTNPIRVRKLPTRGDRRGDGIFDSR